jgi:hypothetical protein
VPMSMQAWALLAVTVSDHVRLPIRARKELILTIIFFVYFGAQSGCTGGVVPAACGLSALKFAWGAFSVEGG